MSESESRPKLVSVSNILDDEEPLNREELEGNEAREEKSPEKKKHKKDKKHKKKHKKHRKEEAAEIDDEELMML